MITLDLLRNIQRLANASPNFEAFKEQLKVMIMITEAMAKKEQ